MANELEIRWLNLVAPLKPRFIESEGVWCVAWDNEFEREVERFATKDEAVDFCKALSGDHLRAAITAKQTDGRGE